MRNKKKIVPAVLILMGICMLLFLYSPSFQLAFHLTTSPSSEKKTEKSVSLPIPPWENLIRHLVRM